MNNLLNINKAYLAAINDLREDQTKTKAVVKRVQAVLSDEEVCYILNPLVYHAGEQTTLGSMLTGILTNLKYQALSNMIIEEIGEKGFKTLSSQYKSGKGTRANLFMIRRIWTDLRNDDAKASDKAKSVRSLLSTGFNKKVEQIDKDIEDFAIVVESVIRNLPGVEVVLLPGKKNMSYTVLVDKTDCGSKSQNVFAAPVPVYENDIQLDIRGTLAEASLEKMTNTLYAVDIEMLNAVEELKHQDHDFFCQLIDSHPVNEASLKAKVKGVVDSINQMKYELAQIDSNAFYSRFLLDFRGRAYMLSPISTTSSDCGKSLMRLGHKAPLGTNGLHALLQGFAGSLGKDKASWKDRFAFGLLMQDTGTKIGSLILTDPVAGFKALLDINPDKVFNAASYCLELSRLTSFINEGGKAEDFMTGFMIQLDCTCSGIQLQSLLTGNRNLAELVNVVKSEDVDGPANDLYSALADVILDKLVAQHSDNPNAQVFINMTNKDRRKLLKPVVMIGSYGGTDRKLGDEVIAASLHHFDNDWAQAQKLSALVMAAYKEAITSDPTFKSLGEFKAIAAEFAKSFKGESHPMWVIPIDLGYDRQVIRTKYLKVPGRKHFIVVEGKSREIETYSLGELMGREKVNHVVKNQDKSVTAMAPNLIHSLDAMLLHSLVMKMDGNVGLTHDCYAVHPADMNKLQVSFKETLVEMFTGDNAGMLQKLTGHVTAGALDADEIMNGTHGIC